MQITFKNIYMYIDHALRYFVKMKQMQPKKVFYQSISEAQA